MICLGIIRNKEKDLGALVKCKMIICYKYVAASREKRSLDLSE